MNLLEVARNVYAGDDKVTAFQNKPDPENRRLSEVHLLKENLAGAIAMATLLAKAEDQKFVRILAIDTGAITFGQLEPGEDSPPLTLNSPAYIELRDELTARGLPIQIEDYVDCPPIAGRG